MPYDPMLVQPMIEELTSIGVEDLSSPDKVDRFVDAPGTALVVINSVCGCAAGGARPAVRLALAGHGARPDRVGTVFAGQQTDSTARARGHFAEYPPSSPSMALLRDGKPVAFIPRHRIEGRTPESVAADLASLFEQHCGTAAATR